MTTIFTCGHKAKNEDDEGHAIATKAYTRENNKAIDYRTVCNNCYRIYEEEDMILFGEAAIEKWLDGE